MTKNQNIDPTSSEIRRVVYECLKERKETGNKEIIVGMTPEILLMIADKLEDYELANASADEAIFDEETHWPEDESEIQ